jgi:hypothetical protein
VPSLAVVYCDQTFPICRVQDGTFEQVSCCFKCATLIGTSSRFYRHLIM